MNIFKCCINPTKNKVKIGIDEAGRGPVLGYLVYGCIIYEYDSNYGFKDSKKLSKEMREKMYNTIINSNINYIYNALHPKYLTIEMSKRSLNQISYESVFKILDKVFENYSNCEIYIDALGNNDYYLSLLNKRYPKKNFIVKNKADSLFDVVSGASILAKYIRDQLLSEYTDVSGYPSDLNTIKWLSDNFDPVFGFKDIVRYSWSTAQNYFKKRNPKSYLEGKFKSLSLEP